MKIRASLLFSLLIIGSLQAQTVTQITSDEAINPSEVSVSINPTDPDNIVAVSMQYGKPGEARVTNYAYVTMDGGKTWTSVPMQNPELRVQGDDAVTFDAAGVAYRSYIAFHGLRETRPKVSSNGIFISKSMDGGLTWETPVPVVDHLNTLMPFEDKPWLVTDNVTDSPHKDNIYISWTRFDDYGSESPQDSTQIFFSRSDDGGQTYAMPFPISDKGGNAVDSDETLEGVVPSIGLNGEVYVVWAGAEGLVFDKSLDGGWTFGEDKIITNMPGGWDIDIEGIMRHNGMPVTGVDQSAGENSGSIYVNWLDQRHGDPDVFVLNSRDGGDSWSAPIRVNNDEIGNGNDQMFTWMAVDPVDGSVNIFYFDRQEDEKIGATLARSVDGGLTFQHFPVDISFEGNAGVFFGDYSGVSAHNGQVVAAFPHFIGEEELAISVAKFQFELGSITLIED